MKWVRVGTAYWNMGQIDAFFWSGGKLAVYWHGDGEPDFYEDPERLAYLRICRALGVPPVLGEDPDGKG